MYVYKVTLKDFEDEYEYYFKHEENFKSIQFNKKVEDCVNTTIKTCGHMNFNLFGKLMRNIHNFITTEVQEVTMFVK